MSSQQSTISAIKPDEQPSDEISDTESSLNITESEPKECVVVFISRPFLSGVWCLLIYCLCMYILLYTLPGPCMCNIIYLYFLKCRPIPLSVAKEIPTLGMYTIYV